MKKLGVLVVLLGAVLAQLQLTASPAAADSGVLAYPSGDAPRRIDITSLHVANNTNRVRVALRVRDLRATGTFTLFWVSEDYQTGFDVRVRRDEEGLVARFRYRPKIGWHVTPCPSATISWAAREDVIRAQVPQDCYPYELPDHWIFGAFSRLGHAKDALGDHTIQLDRG